MEVVNIRDKVENEQTSSYMKPILQLQEEEEESIHISSSSPPPPPPTATTSPPSASASPTHEFSFTISLHPSKSTQQDGGHNKYYENNHSSYNIDKHTSTSTPTSGPLTAIDLSPADDIFFHGHLLPLHLLSHLPISSSPRSSTNSMDSFTLPMKDIQHNNPIGNTSFHYHHRNTFSDFNDIPNNANNPTRPKSKSFSIFNRPKSKKDEEEEDPKAKKKLKLEVSQLIKRYMKLVSKPMLSFQKAKTRSSSSSNNNNNNELFNRQAHSFSGNLVSSRRSSGVLMRRGEFSAPVSMRTSPANSGVLSPSAISSTTSDSTMEELQAAIQSAIAHCKNSITMDHHKTIQP